MNPPEYGKNNSQSSGLSDHCEQSLGNSMGTAQGAALAVHLKVGFIRREPWILWIGSEKSALIHLGDAAYKRIAESVSRSLVGKERTAASEAAFISYAEQLSRNTLSGALAAHPGSVEFDTARIRKFRIIATYDSEMNRFDDYERFILQTESAEYKGGFERKTSLEPWLPLFAAWFGERYQYQTMEGFPFL